MYTRNAVNSCIQLQERMSVYRHMAKVYSKWLTDVYDGYIMHITTID